MTRSNCPLKSPIQQARPPFHTFHRNQAPLAVAQRVDARSWHFCNCHEDICDTSPTSANDSIHNYIDTYSNTLEALNRTVPGSNNRERIFNCQNSRLQSRIVPKIRISSSMHCWNGTVWAPSASNFATIRFCSTSEEGSRKELQLFMQFWSPVKVRKIVRNSMALQHDQKNAPLNGPYGQGAMRPKRFTAWQPWSLSAKRTWRVDHGTLELKQPVISSMIDPKTTLLSFMDSWCLSSASTRKYIQFGRSWAWLRKYRRVDMHKTMQLVLCRVRKQNVSRNLCDRWKAMRVWRVWLTIGGLRNPLGMAKCLGPDFRRKLWSLACFRMVPGVFSLEELVEVLSWRW